MPDAHRVRGAFESRPVLSALADVDARAPAATGFGARLASDRPLDRHTFVRLVVLVTGWALLLRLPTLASRSFWLDETYTAWFASQPLHALWTSVPLYETHPPFYYTLLKGWMALVGPGEAALRSLSVIASVLTVALLPVCARWARLGARAERVALLAALLLSMNGASIQYAQQARPYAIQALAGSLAVFFAAMMVRAFTPGAPPGAAGATGAAARLPTWTIGLALSAGLTLWLHNTGVFAALGIWTGLTLALLLATPGPRGRQALAVGAAGIGALLIWSPFVPMLLRQQAAMATLSFWVTFHVKGMIAAWTVISGGQVLHYPAMLLVLLGFAWLWQHARAHFWQFGCTMALPILAMGAYSFFIKPVFLSRLFLWLGPLGMVLVALGITYLPARWRLPVLGVVLALAGWSTLGFYRSQTEDWRGLLKGVARDARPGDLILAFPNEVQMPVMYYMRPGTPAAAQAPVLYLPGPFPALHLPRRYIGNSGAPNVAQADIDRLQTLLPGYRRVWLIERLGELYDPDKLVMNELGRRYRLAHTLFGDGANIRLYDTPSNPATPAPASPAPAGR
jgi:mannosyltransferase